jgi:SAM-dependent methyltransferase
VAAAWWGREQYFALGEEAVQIIQSTIRAVGAGEPGTVLDLPCGHGRVLRSLKAAFPQAHLTACDIDHDAVDFCAETFEAEPVYSSVQPRDISPGTDFDLIWCGSLLTHLDADRFVGFLELFASCLAPEGVIVFTTSGHHAFRILQRLLSSDEASVRQEPVDRQYFPIPDAALAGFAEAYETEGFAYREVIDNFGTSLSSPAWVCGRLERLPRLRLVNYLEQGWGSMQDVVACQRR